MPVSAIWLIQYQTRRAQHACIARWQQTTHHSNRWRILSMCILVLKTTNSTGAFMCPQGSAIVNKIVFKRHDMSWHDLVSAQTSNVSITHATLSAVHL